MLESRSYYRTALYLSIVNALINTSVWNHLVVYSQDDPLLSSHSLIFYVIFLAIPFGLWLGSPVARFLGAIWLVFWAGALLWPLISSGIAPLISRPKFLTMLAYVFSAALCLLIAGILLLSKKFATEFAYERKHLPRYKTILKWSFGGVAILAIIIASFQDILHAAL
jgi:hypothetical protein